MIVRNKRVKTTIIDEYPNQNPAENDDREGIYDGAS